MAGSPAARAVSWYLRRKLKAATNCALSTIFLLAALLWSAVVAARLWAWFAVPVGAPHVGFIQMVGLILLLAAVQPRFYRYRVKVNWRGTIIDAIVTPLMLLGLGYLIRLAGS